MAKPRRSRRSLTTLVVLVLLSVTIITLDQTGKAHFLTSGVKSLASDIYSPLRSGVNGVLDPIGHFFAGAVHYGALQRENQKLQNEIGALEQARAESAWAKGQYQALQQLLTLEKLPSLSALPMVAALTTARDITDFAATITIDKGRDDGVTLGDAVVGAGGLIGQVVAASHSTSTVRLITDGQSAVGVGYGHNQYATVDGQGASRPLSVQFVASTTTVSDGELLTTSSLQGSAFPPGIPVATVTSVKTIAGAADKDVTAKPYADLAALTYVAVVQWAPGP